MSTISESPKILFPGDLHRVIKGPSELMQDAISVMYNFSPLQSDLNTGEFATKNWFSADCILSRTKTDACKIGRTRAQSENGAHLVYVQRFLYGGVRGGIGDFNIDRDPGAVYVFDQAKRVNCIQFPTEAEGIYVKKSSIGFNPDRHSPLIAFPTSSTLGRLLDKQIDSLLHEAYAHNMIERDKLDSLIACLRVALGTDRGYDDIRQKARREMTKLICQFVEERLNAPDLSVDSILRSFGVSRASLYRMFEVYGGVREYISQRRLFAAVLELADAPHVRGKISEVSENWGFSSGSNFNRAVRRQFGVAPGSLVNIKPLDRQFSIGDPRVGELIKSL